MMKVKGLEDFGCWLKKGEIVIVNNNLGLMVVRKGYAENLGYIKDVEDKRTIGRKDLNKRFKLLKRYNISLKPNYTFKQMIEIIEKVEKWMEKRGN